MIILNLHIKKLFKQIPRGQLAENEIIMAKLRIFVIFNYSIMFVISYHVSPKLNMQH